MLTDRVAVVAACGGGKPSPPAAGRRFSFLRPAIR